MSVLESEFDGDQHEAHYYSHFARIAMNTDRYLCDTNYQTSAAFLVSHSKRDKCDKCEVICRWLCTYDLHNPMASLHPYNSNHEPHHQQPFADEELEEIRRYEDFTTIDWIQDSILERNRRINKAQTVYNEERGPHGEVTIPWLWAQLRKIADASQTWFVVSLVGESQPKARLHLILMNNYSGRDLHRVQRSSNIHHN